MFRWDSLGNHHTNQTGKHIESIAGHFSDAGGEFVVPAVQLAGMLEDIRALVFDWDGVFNDGAKDAGKSSTFSEADSMGTNLLRYGLRLHHGSMPVAAVISGERNATARQFVLREHFDCLYTGIKDKRLAVDHLCSRFGLEHRAIACVFDDVNDLAMAKTCGVRFLIRRSASPLLADYARSQGLCDYVSGSSPKDHAVREVSELFLGLLGQFSSVVGSRTMFDSSYRDYFDRRQAIDSRFYSQAGDEIVAWSPMDEKTS